MMVNYFVILLVKIKNECCDNDDVQAQMDLGYLYASDSQTVRHSKLTVVPWDAPGGLFFQLSWMPLSWIGRICANQHVVPVRVKDHHKRGVL